MANERQLQDELPPAGGPESEVLAFGPAVASGPRRRTLVVVAVLVVLVLAALAAWRVVPRPLPPFSLADLQGVYSGMVRSDGTNQVSTVTRDKLTEPPVTVAPAECAPLFDATASNQFPASALDGVSTYWLAEESATVSLTTYRYVDAAAASREYDAVAAALAVCTGNRVELDDRGALTLAQPVTPLADVDNHLSYEVTPVPGQNRFTTDVAQVDNTVTWQYRYDYRRRGGYSPLPAHQVMVSLTTQMHDVQQANRRPRR